MVVIDLVKWSWYPPLSNTTIENKQVSGDIWASIACRYSSGPNDAFVRLSQGRISRPVTPLQSRSFRMKWHVKTVMQDGRIRLDHGLFGDATAQDAMLKYAGKKVLIGIDPNDYRSPAMVRGWEDDRLRGRVLIDCLPLCEATRHGDETGRRRAVTEERRVKKRLEQHQIADADRKVAKLPQAVMAA